MEYDIHNQEKKIKGRFTHDFKHSSGVGFTMKHERKLVSHTIEVIQKMDVPLIIEFGTFKAGFTKLLEDGTEAEIHTFDLIDHCPKIKKHFSPRVVFHVEVNVLEADNHEVVELIKRPEKKLLYCDNGRKKQEVEMYSKLLRSGDFIGVHDWGNEIFWSDVEPYVGTWEKFCWSELEEVGVTSRFWRK